MISGWVNAYREAVLHLSLRSFDDRERRIEAVIDTGFNGYLTLPPHIISELALPFRRNGRAVLGDGSTVTFDIHEAVILWEGRPRRIPVDSADSEPLLGMRLRDAALGVVLKAIEQAFYLFFQSLPPRLEESLGIREDVHPHLDRVALLPDEDLRDSAARPSLIAPQSLS